MAKANVITNFAPNSPNAAGATKMKIVALEQAFINDRPIAYSASRCECVNAEYTTNETQRVKKKSSAQGKSIMARKENCSNLSTFLSNATLYGQYLKQIQP